MPSPWDTGFGIVTLIAGLVALFIWFPLDIRGGFIEAGVSGQRQPGDAFFPVLLASAIVLLSVVHLTAVLLRRGRSGATDGHNDEGRLTRANIRFLVLFHAIVLCGMAAMYWLGPAVVWVMQTVGVTEAGYRQLVDTAPYKYIGYVLGGGAMTMTLIAWAERGVERRSWITVTLVILGVLFIFDGLLSNVQLPPNADY